MNASMDPSPIPPHAITMWLSDHDIIVALPMRAGGPPYLMKLPLNEGGLLKALNLLRERKAEVLSGLEAAEMHRILGASQPADHPPQVKLSKSQEKLHNETTQDQRDRARVLLEKMGIK
jgi:hypothetical protein